MYFNPSTIYCSILCSLFNNYNSSTYDLSSESTFAISAHDERQEHSMTLLVFDLVLTLGNILKIMFTTSTLSTFIIISKNLNTTLMLVEFITNSFEMTSTSLYTLYYNFQLRTFTLNGWKPNSVQFYLQWPKFVLCSNNAFDYFLF